LPSTTRAREEAATRNRCRFVQASAVASLLEVRPEYPLVNKGATSIRDVTTGVRNRDGRDHEFTTFKKQLVGPGETCLIRDTGSVPVEWLDTVHESDAFTAFLYCAQFTDTDGVRWEVVYDPLNDSNEWAEITTV
jgi:hypothetical protein